MNNFRRYYFKVLKKLCEYLHASRIVETPVGIKIISGIKVQIPCKKNSGEIKTLSSEELFLGPDLLKNKYTLLGCNIKESPHYSLMKDLLNNQDIENSAYIKRRELGTIDARIGTRQKLPLNIYKERFAKRYQEIINQTYSPVLVYKVGKKYFIYDGKHRAALCTALNMPIRCKDISVEYSPSQSFFYICEWKRNDSQY